MSGQVILTRHFLPSFLRHRHFFSHYYYNRLTLSIQRMLLPHWLILIASPTFSRLYLSICFRVTLSSFTCSFVGCPILIPKMTQGFSSPRLPFFRLESYAYSFRKIYFMVKNLFVQHPCLTTNPSFLEFYPRKFYFVAFPTSSTWDLLAKLG